VIDAIGRSDRHWDQIGKSKRFWVLLLAAGIPIGLGFVAALIYFTTIRPKLSAAEIMAFVALWGDEGSLTP
jgi:hypothetical protein